MRLEQSLYGVRPVEELRVYQVGDLESLSAVALGYGSGPKMPGELGGGLTIRPLGSSQIHIHEGAGGSANIKHGKDSTPISSYNAALIDLLMDYAGIKKIETTDKGKRKGRT